MKKRTAPNAARNARGRSAFGLTASGRGWYKRLPGTGTRWIASFAAAPTAADADRIFAERYPQLTEVRSAVWTVNDLADAWIDSRRRLGRGEKTIQGYNRSADLFVDAVGEQTPAEACGPIQFRAMIDAIATLAPQTRANHVINIRSMFQWAVESGHIPPVRFGPDFSPPSTAEIRRSRKIRLYTPQQVRTLIDKATGHLKLCVLLGINGGLGGLEIAGLRPEHIDGDKIVMVRHKTGADRIVPLWPETVAQLKATPLPVVTSKGLAIVRWNHNQLSKWFGDLCAQAGVPDLGHYTLRRTFRTIADETLDDRAIALIMGHAASGRDVAARYIQRIGENRLRAVVEHVREVILHPPSTATGRRGKTETRRQAGGKGSARREQA